MKDSGAPFVRRYPLKYTLFIALLTHIQYILPTILRYKCGDKHLLSTRASVYSLTKCSLFE
ncbi:hypothetical protein XBKB1_4190064 [Xenorhabdus bovienii str. kraussei Becker Underwood]|uniref:Uncharacterized protein n=1 Tax=Xenorhabdus bovienii str. kraussei Becker Underwood TaxID=1398204 RepID=A0A077Q1E4_XENBV|nr:hypothetical protein XBKB1_4190064 [Xenorhabdus bovienii str. kraussei Becker Underwood]